MTASAGEWTLIRSLDRSGLKRFAVARVVICVQLAPVRLGPAWRFPRRNLGINAPAGLGQAWSADLAQGRQWLRLEQRLSWPDGWIDGDSCRARLVLSWWAEQMRLWVDGVLVHEGDLFDTACRWLLPQRSRQGAALDLVLELCSPLHDDGALISSHLDLEPQPEVWIRRAHCCLRPWTCIWRRLVTCRRNGPIWIPAVWRRRLLSQRS